MACTPLLCIKTCAAVQVVCCGSLLLALNFLKPVNNAYFRIGFNSLGAYGTINHLHFQVPCCACRWIRYCSKETNGLSPAAFAT